MSLAYATGDSSPTTKCTVSKRCGAEDFAHFLALLSLKDSIFSKFQMTAVLVTCHIANFIVFGASCLQNVSLFWQGLQL